eukprot:gnl/Dysnectes_brevis/1719_a1955_1596.p1 GENE.gnl/Dysnectes_brevis/1719_a1955_1596~~gnl/Dysnectes_brevis/1719_a1955_1596.p1  ORF type:complete len:985 (+),score=216.82 gnl/Dysnectes_brevis/1719_a1955_1596:282-3236(+)
MDNPLLVPTSYASTPKYSHKLISHLHTPLILSTVEHPCCSSCKAIAVSPRKTQCGLLLCLHCHQSKSVHLCSPQDSQIQCAIVPITSFAREFFRKCLCTCPFKHNGCEEVMPITEVGHHIEKYCQHVDDAPQTSLLVRQLKGDLYNPDIVPICSHCSHLTISPLNTSCGSTLCLQCYSTHTVCPRCSSSECSLSPLSDDLLYSFRKIYCTCPYRHQGCEEVMPICEVAFHLEHCPHAIIDCPVCGTAVLRSGIGFHTHFKCAKRPVECTRCNTDIPLDQYFGHDDEEHPVCPGCRCRYDRATESQHHGVSDNGHLVCDSEHIGLNDPKKLKTLLVDLTTVRHAFSAFCSDIDDMSSIHSSLEYLRLQAEDTYRYLVFRTPESNRDVTLYEGGRTAVKNTSKGDDIILLAHPGINEGVWEWSIKIVDMKASIYIGASPPMPSGTAKTALPGSIGMSSFSFVNNGASFKLDGFNFTTGDTVIVQINFDHKPGRYISWQLSNHTDVVRRPLPLPGPYTLAVGVYGIGSVVRITKCKRYSLKHDAFVTLSEPPSLKHAKPYIPFTAPNPPQQQQVLPDPNAAKVVMTTATATTPATVTATATTTAAAAAYNPDTTRTHQQHQQQYPSPTRPVTRMTPGPIPGLSVPAARRRRRGLNNTELLALCRVMITDDAVLRMHKSKPNRDGHRWQKAQAKVARARLLLIGVIDELGVTDTQVFDAVKNTRNLFFRDAKDAKQKHIANGFFPSQKELMHGFSSKTPRFYLVMMSSRLLDEMHCRGPTILHPEHPFHARLQRCREYICSPELEALMSEGFSQKIYRGFIEHGFYDLNDPHVCPTAEIAAHQHLVPPINVPMEIPRTLVRPGPARMVVITEEQAKAIAVAEAEALEREKAMHALAQSQVNARLQAEKEMLARSRQLHPTPSTHVVTTQLVYPTSNPHVSVPDQSIPNQWHIHNATVALPSAVALPCHLSPQADGCLNPIADIIYRFE